MKEFTIEQKAKAYDEALERAEKLQENSKGMILKKWLWNVFPELQKSNDEKIKERVVATIHLYYGEPLEDEAKEMIVWLEKQCQTFAKKDVDDAYLKGVCDAKHELEKQGEQKPTMDVKEAWKEMRIEVYAQASGNRHEPNCSDNSTKMFSLNDIDEIIECINERTTQGKSAHKARLKNCAILLKKNWSTNCERENKILVR